VIVDDKGIKDSWKEYMKKLMNKENEWDHAISAEVKEGPAGEVAAALKKMTRHKAPGLSGLTAEMIQATEGIGTQWLLDLCNGIVKEGCIPEDWKSNVILPIYKGKGDPMERGSYRGIKLFEHAMKVVERIFENRIRQQIEVDDMQFGFMKGKGTTDAIFTARRFASAVLATAIPYVCPSVTRWYCVKMMARSTVQFALSDSKMCLVL